MFYLSIRWGWRHDNPCRGIERNPEGKRARYSEGRRARPPDHGARRVRRSGGRERGPALPLNGARSGEVSAPSGQMSISRTGIWTKPGVHDQAANRASRPAVGAGDRAAVGIRAAAADDAEFVFPGRQRRPSRRSPQEAMAKDLQGGGGLPAFACTISSHLRELAGVRRLLAAHDRRAVRAYAAETTARYAHLFDDPLRVATDRVGAMIAGKPAPRCGGCANDAA